MSPSLVPPAVQMGATALHVAAMRGHERVTEALLLAGADPAARDVVR